MVLSFFCLISLLAITTGLSCRTAQADSPYLSKHHAARRGYQTMRIPPSGVDWTFNVRLGDQFVLSPFEHVAIVGDIKALGGWLPQESVLLNRTDRYNVWTVTINVPANERIINYRYFIAAVDRVSGGIQIRKWESHFIPRMLAITNNTKGYSNDEFGIINGIKEAKRGWLNSGNILQFKLFRNPIRFYENPTMYKSQISIKVVPVEFQEGLAPILPSARAKTEYVRMKVGDSLIRSQPEYGVPFEKDDILIFHTTTADLDDVAYLVEVFYNLENTEVVNRLGYQYIYPDAINRTEGSFTTTLISSTWKNPIGLIDIQYLLIKPLPGPVIDFRGSFAEYWRQNWTILNVGHRGLGKSFKQTAAAAPIIENTIASMKESAVIGTDLVEFDVQLTSDYIPIIYHDYMVYVCMDPKTPTSKDDLTQVLIKDLTYEQLTALTTYQVIGSKIIEYPAHNAEVREDYRLFPRFEDFLTTIDKTVGFDIEIKWPQLKSNGDFESIQTIDKNVYVDKILDVMLRKGCGRLSFFTSFDADICSLLRFKQNMYPVMFLFPSKEDNFADPRSSTIPDTINNAQAFDLMGIVPHASFIAKDTNLVKRAHDAGKQIFLWGDDLNSTESIEWFKKTEPTGVIYDRLDLVLPIGHQNIFSQSPDLPEFFQQQCFSVVDAKSQEPILSNRIAEIQGTIGNNL